VFRKRPGKVLTYSKLGENRILNQNKKENHGAVGNSFKPMTEESFPPPQQGRRGRRPRTIEKVEGVGAGGKKKIKKTTGVVG